MNRFFVMTLWVIWIVAAGAGESLARRSWDRPVGHRLQKYATHKESRPRPYKLQDIPASAKEIERQILALDDHPAVQIKRITSLDALFPIYRIHLAASRSPRGSRKGKTRRPMRVLMDGWLHGDEPVGAYTIPAFVKWALKHKSYRERFDTTLYVKLDSSGERDTPAGKNLNRCFENGKWTTETRAIRDTLDPRRYDLFLGLHGSGGGAPGSWLIRGNDDGNMSRRILGAMATNKLWDVPPAERTVASEVCKCDFSFHSLGGVTSNSTGTFKWYMSQRQTPYSYTLEVPRNLIPRQQIQTSLKLIRSAIFNVEKHGEGLHR